MDAVKKAIRSALEKGDARDRAFREKVYRQAFTALDRSLNARPDLSAEETLRQREQVKAAIIEIERGFLAAPENGGRTASPASPQPQRREAPVEKPVPPPEHDFAPRIQRDERTGFSEAPQSEYVPAEDVRVPMAGRERERRPFAVLFLIATLVAAIGIGAWWTFQSGILQSAQERDTSVPNPQPGAEGEDFDPESGAPVRTAVDPEGTGITIFSPDDPTTVSAPAGASAELISEEDGEFLRVGASSATTAVSFDVGQGMLERLAGERAVFNLTARAEEGRETQISISCNFGTLGNCGRTRYLVGALPAEYLFEVELPDVQPRAGGTISIIPDIEGQGRTLDIFSLRVTTAE